MGLFSPVWMTNDYNKKEKAAAAVRKITDQKKLLEIVMTAPMNSTKEAAIETITDQQALYAILRALSGKELVAGLTAAACKGLNDQALLKQLAMEGFSGYGDIVKKITDPKDLAEIAMQSSSSAKRCQAADRITDADTLLKIMTGSPDADVRRTARERFSSRFIGQFTKDKNQQLTDEQKTRYVDALIAETDTGYDPRIDSDLDEDSVRRIRREARRDSMRAAAFCRLVHSLPVEQLADAYKEAQANHRREDIHKQQYWGEAADIVERRIVRDGKENTALLTGLIRDKDIGANMASRCVGMLYGKELDGTEGIDALRAEAVETYLKNIPAYGGEDSYHNKDYCLSILATALPADELGKYGFDIKQYECEDEDQYGRNTYTKKIISYKGRRLS